MVEVVAKGDHGREDAKELREGLRAGRGGTGGAVGETAKRFCPIEGRLDDARDRMVPSFDSLSTLVELFQRGRVLDGVLSTEDREGELLEVEGEMRL